MYLDFVYIFVLENKAILRKNLLYMSYGLNEITRFWRPFETMTTKNWPVTGNSNVKQDEVWQQLRVKSWRLDSCGLHHCRHTHHFWHRFCWCCHCRDYELFMFWLLCGRLCIRLVFSAACKPRQDSRLTAFAIFSLIWFEALISETWPELVLFGWRLVLCVSMSLQDVKSRAW